MKKYLFYIIMLLCFISFKNVYAEDIDITAMELSDKSDTAVEKSPATFEGLNTYFDIQFANVEDYIEYTVTLKNNSDTDYAINEGKQFDNSGHIQYSFELDGDDDVVLAGSTRTGHLVVAYIKKVDTDNFVGGVYTESNQLSLLLSKETSTDTITNPNTYHNILVIIIVLLGVGVVAFLTLKKRSKVLVVLLITLLLYPLYEVFAYQKLYIVVNPKIEILIPVKEFCVAESYFTDSGEMEEVKYFSYQEGMTWDSYANNEEFIDDWFVINDYDSEIDDYRYMLDFPLFFIDTDNKYNLLTYDGHNEKYNSSIPSEKIKPKEDGCYFYNLYDGVV